MEQAFEDFVKENWPGYTKPEAFFDFGDACKFEFIKNAFKAGFEAGEEKVLKSIGRL